MANFGYIDKFAKLFEKAPHLTDFAQSFHHFAKTCAQCDKAPLHCHIVASLLSRTASLDPLREDLYKIFL